MRLPRVLAGGALAALLAGTAACGLQTVAPELEPQKAASALAAARTGAFRVSLPNSPADVRAFLAATGDGGPVDDAELRTVDRTAYLRVDVPGLVAAFPAVRDGVDAARRGAPISPTG